MDKYREIEKSIIKKYRREIWSKFIKAIKDYKLLNAGDHIAVCISGGKDSFLLAKCFDELKRHNQIDFKVSFISMNPGYHPDHFNEIKANAKLLNLDIQYFDAPIFEIANKHSKNNPCYLCARMRRGYLYDYAKQLGCNKIALAHHFDDVIETTMLNLLYAGNISTMPPKLNSTNFEGMELIRPLYYIKEQDVLSWKNYNNLTFLDCGCVVTAKKKSSKRSEIKALIKDLETKYKDIPKNIFTALNKETCD